MGVSDGHHLLVAGVRHREPHRHERRGMDKLKGKKIGLLYHDSAYGKESHAIMDKLAAKHGFEVIKIPVAHPGNEQQSQWLQIRQAKPTT